MQLKQSRGHSVIELVIAITIIGVLTSLLLPAIQSAREAARLAQCSSNLRQATLCSLGQVNLSNHLPESRFHFDHDGKLKREVLWGQFHTEAGSSLQYDFPFTGLAQQTSSGPSHLKCPTAPPAATLTGLPIRIDDTTILTAAVETSDYRGNRGVLDPAYANHPGCYSVFRDNTPSRGLSFVEDGLSQTIFAWETIGAFSVEYIPRTGRIRMLPWSSTQLNRSIPFDGAENRYHPGTSGQLFDGYYHGWIGFAAGHIGVMRVGPAEPNGNFDIRYLNTNHHGDPFSFHPSGINCSFGDGRIQMLDRAIELSILVQLADPHDGKPMVTANAD